MNGSCWTVQELRYYRYSLELNRIKIELCQRFKEQLSLAPTQKWKPT